MYYTIHTLQVMFQIGNDGNMFRLTYRSESLYYTDVSRNGVYKFVLLSYRLASLVQFSVFNKRLYRINVICCF